MSIFDLFTNNIDKAISQYNNTKDALLIDVREKDEYVSGHIPNSINLPLSEINKYKDILKDKNQIIYVYCLSGSRSNQAVNYLINEGFKNISNIGGISRYTGEIER